MKLIRRILDWLFRRKPELPKKPLRVTPQCPFCKNVDTNNITGRDLLVPGVPTLDELNRYHGGKPYRAFHCSCCNGFWHGQITPTP